MVVKEYHLYIPWLSVDWRKEAFYERTTDKGPKEGETQEDSRGLKEPWDPVTDWAQILCVPPYQWCPWESSSHRKSRRNVSEGSPNHQSEIDSLVKEGIIDVQGGETTPALLCEKWNEGSWTHESNRAYYPTNTDKRNHKRDHKNGLNKQQQEQLLALLRACAWAPSTVDTSTLDVDRCILSTSSSWSQTITWVAAEPQCSKLAKQHLAMYSTDRHEVMFSNVFGADICIYCKWPSTHKCL